MRIHIHTHPRHHSNYQFTTPTTSPTSTTATSMETTTPDPRRQPPRARPPHAPRRPRPSQQRSLSPQPLPPQQRPPQPPVLCLDQDDLYVCTHTMVSPRKISLIVLAWCFAWIGYTEYPLTYGKQMHERERRTSWCHWINMMHVFPSLSCATCWPEIEELCAVTSAPGCQRSLYGCTGANLDVDFHVAALIAS